MSGVVKGPTSIKNEPSPNPARTETGFEAKTQARKSPKNRLDLKMFVVIARNKTTQSLNVLITKTSNEIETTVSKKPTFSGLYTKWGSYTPTK